jgi:hypothetical protein
VIETDIELTIKAVNKILRTLSVTVRQKEPVIIATKHENNLYENNLYEIFIYSEEIMNEAIRTEIKQKIKQKIKKNDPSNQNEK